MNLASQNFKGNQQRTLEQPLISRSIKLPRLPKLVVNHILRYSYFTYTSMATLCLTFMYKNANNVFRIQKYGNFKTDF